MSNTKSNMTEQGYMLYRQWEKEDRILFKKFADQDCLDVVRALAELLSGNVSINTYVTF